MKQKTSLSGLLTKKITEGAAISSSLSTKYGHEDNHYMKDIANALLIYFVIGSLTTLLYYKHHYLLYAMCFPMSENEILYM